MAGLLDIADLSRKVSVRGTEIDVKGISAEGIAYLIQTYPEVKQFFMGKVAELNEQSLFALGPKIVASVIAAGCGYPGDAKAEKAAASLGVGDQLELIAPIFELTFPAGIGPFVERLTAFSEGSSNALNSNNSNADSGATGKVRASK